jgi:CPA2 family monovalent cation:H+ antiporter-2
MPALIAAGSSEAALAFVEIGAVVLGLALLARLAGRLGITAVPLYLIAGLALGEGGLVQLDVTEDFISIIAEIGVLLLLFTLGLEYSDVELRSGLRTGVLPGIVLGWSPLAAVLLGGATWVSSSGVVSKVLTDLHRLGFRETPAILNLLVIEDLAMAVYLPVVAALIVGGTLLATLTSVAIALAVVTVILLSALFYGRKLSDLLIGGSDESLLLAVFGVTLLVAGIAQQLEVSGAIGAFLVGLALSGQAEKRAIQLITPLRDLFAAIFFLFFSFQVDPAKLLDALLPAFGLAVVTACTKMLTGWFAAKRVGAAQKGRLRAGATLIARGEFSIVIAALGAGLVEGPELGALVAGYVLVTAIMGPLAAKYANNIKLPSRKKRQPAAA